MTRYKVTWKDGTVETVEASSPEQARQIVRRRLAMRAPSEFAESTYKGTRHSIRSVESS